MQKKRPTIRDVAELAHVSPAVVSRVYHPNPPKYVSAAARKRVLDAISELNYHPDTRASFLRTNRTYTIGLYYVYGLLYLDHEFGLAIFDGLQAACGELNQDILVFHPIKRGAEEISLVLSSAKVDGIIYYPGAHIAEFNETLHNINKPIVRIGEPHPQSPSVVADDYNGAARLAQHLYLRGHRKVLFRREKLPLISAQRRFDGFCDAAKRLDMQVISMRAASIRDAMTEEEELLLLRFRAEGITAVTCWRDGSAAELLNFCKQHNINVPEDLAIAGFDGLRSPNCPPEMQLTTLVIDWHLIAEKSVKMLIDIIEGRKVPEEQIVTGSLYIGNTT
jgi:DNA-binding LacI/PurR family transcriptional regulator